MKQLLIHDIIPPDNQKKQFSSKQLFFGQIRTKVSSLKLKVSSRTRLRRRNSRHQDEPRLIQDIYSRR